MNMIRTSGASTAVFDFATSACAPADHAQRLLAMKLDARGQIAVGKVLRSASFRAGSSRLACNALQLTGRDVTTVAPRLVTDSAFGRPPT